MIAGNEGRGRWLLSDESRNVKVKQRYDELPGWLDMEVMKEEGRGGDHSFNSVWFIQPKEIRKKGECAGLRNQETCK